MAWNDDSKKLVFQLFDNGESERTIVRELRDKYKSNDKTVRRCLAGLHLVKASLESRPTSPIERERFERLGGTDHYKSELLWAYQAYRNPVTGSSTSVHLPDSVGLGQQENHRRVLMEPLLELRDLKPLEVHDYDLAIWHSRPDEPSWAITKGRMWRVSDGGLEIRLDIEARLEYQYLHQHLLDDLIWSSLENCKKVMIKDLEARLALLKKVTALVEKPEEEGGTGLSVIPDMSFGTEEAALSTYYTFTIHDQVLSRCLGLKYGAKEMGQFSRERPNLTRLGSYSVISGTNAERQRELIEFLLRAQVEWANLPETSAAADAFLSAESATVEVRKHIDRLRLAVGFPPGSRCDGCDPGVISQSGGTLSSSSPSQT